MSQTPYPPSYVPFPPPFARRPPGRALSFWALGVGLGALVLSWVPVFGIALGLAAIVLGAIGLAQAGDKVKPAIGLALGVVALIINVVVLVALSSTAVKQVNAAATAPATVTATTEPVVDPTTVAPVVAPTTKPATTKPSPPPVKHTTAGPTVEEQNAIEAAQGYLSFTAFSRKGLIRQLSSDAGDGYSLKAATYAVDSLHINYNEQAYKSAKSYLEMTSFSRKGLIEQLESDAGEGFTHAQAVYGVTKAGL